MNIHLITDDYQEETISAILDLLKDAQSGDVIGLVFSAIRRDRTRKFAIAGVASKNPDVAASAAGKLAMLAFSASR